MAKRAPVAVLGATGYTGMELLRLLARHPGVELVHCSSEQSSGRRVADVHPFLGGIVDLQLEAADAATVPAAAEIVFAALPHGASAPLVAALVRSGRRVVDLSADFRLRDPAVYARWYVPHPAPDLLAEAVYGLPEAYRGPLTSARLVAAPGCYPTGALLGLLPLARAGLIDGAVIVDAKSGTTGAGRAARTEQLFAEVNESCRAYALAGHRHLPEIAQELAAAGGGERLVFVPHLLPVSRGILTTLYVPIAGPTTPDLGAIFRSAWGEEPFIVLRGEDVSPELREVRGTNRCSIGWRWDAASRQAIVVTAIDNLGKGAAGQALQCANLMLGQPETTGLDHVALVP